jgi:hypothetical protein
VDETSAEERATDRRWAEHEERQKERERSRDKVIKKKLDDKEAIERWAYQDRRSKRMLIKSKQKEEETRVEHWDSVEGKALVAAKKRAQRASGQEGHAEGDGDEDDGDPDDADEDPDGASSLGQNFETFNFTDGQGGEFQAKRWSDMAPRACDTWRDGPHKHVGGANASIHKAVWIQTHGNATVAQHKMVLEMKSNGVRQGAAFKKLGKGREYCLPARDGLVYLSTRELIVSTLNNQLQTLNHNHHTLGSKPLNTYLRS